VRLDRGAARWDAARLHRVRPGHRQVAPHRRVGAARPARPRRGGEGRTRLLNQVDERRHPKTRATVTQLLDRYLKVLDVDESTMTAYRGYITNHIRPVLGRLQLSRVDGEVLDSFYAELRRSGSAVTAAAAMSTTGRPRDHECDARCRPHACKPLAASTVRQIHWILSGAFDRAVRWNWMPCSPVDSAEPPSPPTPDPDPPTAAEAARIVNAAFRDPDWGALVWTAMTSGARRGELCALRRTDRQAGVLRVPRSVGGRRANLQEKDTKTQLDRPQRPARRAGAKSDPIDAERAARDALARTRLAQPKAGPPQPQTSFRSQRSVAWDTRASRFVKRFLDNSTPRPEALTHQDPLDRVVTIP
jgi:integrase